RDAAVERARPETAARALTVAAARASIIGASLVTAPVNAIPVRSAVAGSAYGASVVRTPIAPPDRCAARASAEHAPRTANADRDRGVVEAPVCRERAAARRTAPAAHA